MKINETERTQLVQGSPGTVPEKSGRSTVAFDRLLAQELDGLEGTAGQGAELSVNGVVPGLFGLDPTAGSWDPQAFEALSAQAGQLDGVAGALADPNASPRTIDTLMQQLGSSADDLQQQLQSLPDGHPLRQIGDELSTLSYVESMKWKRGDYI